MVLLMEKGVKPTMMGTTTKEAGRWERDMDKEQRPTMASKAST